MNRLKLIIWVLIWTMFSCSVDEFDTTNTDPVVVNPEMVYINNIFAKATMSTTLTGINVECMTIQLPFELIDDKGLKYLIVDEFSFNNFLLDSSNITIIDFVYPLTLVNELGDIIIAGNLFDFGSAVANCIPNPGNAWLINFDNSCFRLEYPITINTQDSTPINVMNERDFILLLDTTIAYFRFPLILRDLTGTGYNIRNGGELYNQLASCNSLPGDTIIWTSNFSYIACYEIQFPIQVKISNSDSVVVVQNETTYGEILLQGRLTGYVFPITLLDQSQIISVQNETDLNQLIEACYEPPMITDLLYLLQGGLGGDSIACYTILYPFSVIDSTGGSNVTFQSETELLNFTGSSDFLRYAIVYPVRIRLRFTNIEIELNNVEEIKQVLENC